MLPLTSMPNSDRGQREPFVLNAATMSAVVHENWLCLVRLATLLLGDRASAEEAVQEACEATWRRRPDVTSPAHLHGYLRTAVVNGCRSAGRRRGTAQRHLATVQLVPEPPADAQLLVREERRQTLAAVAELPPRQREVLVLRYWSFLSEAEIAETLGISVGTVKATAHHALNKLRKHLKGQIR